MRPLSPGLPLLRLAALLEVPLARGEPGREINRLASLESADGSAVAVLSHGKYKQAALVTEAAVVVTSSDMSSSVNPAAALLVVPDAYRAYGVLAREFKRLLSADWTPGVDPRAIVDPSARVDASARIGAGAVIGAKVVIAAGVSVGASCVVGDSALIGEGSILHAGVILGEDCKVGSGCTIHSGSVIGSDGFGFARSQGKWEKIPQLGAVVIGNDVEIGANCSIDRGALDDTVIGEGCKLDNLIQVAHNVRIGEHTAIAGCVGIAGSARIGRRCMIGGAAGILGHLEICDDVTISAMSLVTRSIDKPGFYSGIFPLMDNSDWERAAVLLRRLPDLRARLIKLESLIKES